MNDCIHIAVDRATDKAIGYLKNYIEKKWYDSYSPSNYQRTGQFLESATKTEVTMNASGEISCMLFFDTEKIIPRIMKGSLNQHASMSGSDVSAKIPALIERPNPNMIGRKNNKGLGAMERTIQMLEKDFHNMVKKELKAMGIDARVV